jgi:hypothetical protein
MWLELTGVLSVGVYVVKYHLAGHTAPGVDYVYVMIGVCATVCIMAMMVAAECAVADPPARIAALMTVLVATMHDTFKGGHRGAQATAAVMIQLLVATARAVEVTTCTGSLAVCTLVGVAVLVLHRAPSAVLKRITWLNAGVVILILPRSDLYEVPLLLAVACAPVDPKSSYVFAIFSVLAAAANPVAPPTRVMLGCAAVAFSAVAN